MGFEPDDEPPAYQPVAVVTAPSIDGISAAMPSSHLETAICDTTLLGATTVQAETGTTRPVSGIADVVACDGTSLSHDLLRDHEREHGAAKVLDKNPSAMKGSDFLAYKSLVKKNPWSRSLKKSMAVLAVC
jgi:hypothetical protein